MGIERRGADDGTRGVLLGIAFMVVAFLGFGGGYLLGSRGDREVAISSPNPSIAPVSPTPSPTVSPSSTPDPDADELANGRYFVAATAVRDGAPPTVEFDLAYLLTGRQAEQAAADHGDLLETDYYIVNDNPLLRALPVSPVIQVSYVPEGACCSLRPGSFEPWAAAINEEFANDYAGPDAYWWITVQAGEIVRIEEQFLA
jgi:hypothetical protein